MIRCVAILCCIVLSSAARADYLVPVATIRSGTVLSEADFTARSGVMRGVASQYSDVVGMEARVVLYVGRPVRLEDLLRPALVQRNALVPLIFENATLSISTLGRALDRGAEGDLIRVMNMSSRKTLFGLVRLDGSVVVANQ